MAAPRGGRRGRGAAVHDNDERWLLTYADMITLLMALFMVLFSISSVNISKYKTLQQSLKAAFSGSVLPGGKAILQSGSVSTRSISRARRARISSSTCSLRSPSSAASLSSARVASAAAIDGRSSRECSSRPRSPCTSSPPG